MLAPICLGTRTKDFAKELYNHAFIGSDSADRIGCVRQNSTLATNSLRFRVRRASYSIRWVLVGGGLCIVRAGNSDVAFLTPAASPGISNNPRILGVADK